MLSNCINQTYIIRIIFTYQKSLLPFEKFGLISCILTGIFLYQKLQLTRIRVKVTSADIPNYQCQCVYEILEILNIRTFQKRIGYIWNTQCFSWNWLFIRKYISKYINISKTHWESQCIIEIFLYLILNFQCVFEIIELWYFKIFLKTHWAILLANALNAFNALLK